MAGVPVSAIARRHDQRAKMRVFLWMLAVVVGVTLLTVVWAVGFPSAAAGATSRVQGWASPSRGVGGEDGGSGRGLLLTERERMHGIDGGGGGGGAVPRQGGPRSAGRAVFSSWAGGRPGVCGRGASELDAPGGAVPQLSER